MKLYSQYSAASYCDDLYNSSSSLDGRNFSTQTLITCSKGTCPLLQSPSISLLGSVHNIGQYSGTAILSVDTSRRTLVFAFRGAEFLGSTSYARQELVRCPDVCLDCHCFDGFYATWLDIRPKVTSLLTSARAKYPNYDLVFTGHSLGGAQASYAAAEFRHVGVKARLYTYGAPHLGDLAFAKYVSAQGNNWRVTHTTDIAPRLLGDDTKGYRHISPEYWIFEDRNREFSVVEDQVKIVYGFDSKEGNQGTNMTRQVPHVQYFQPQIASCYVNQPED
ncbi:Alpha/Beta hydrolase protein [Tricladium varicosporioides]|nr:Alpha/Beta hydrolase protein [Hymenoscyphus varicosporioides]